MTERRIIAPPPAALVDVFGAPLSSEPEPTGTFSNLLPERPLTPEALDEAAAKIRARRDGYAGPFVLRPEPLPIVPLWLLKNTIAEDP